MSAVLLAVFEDYAGADHVRTDLVKDGFPTDRVELTALRDPGRASAQPAPSLKSRIEQHLRTLLQDDQGQPLVDALIDRITAGAATITVQPRGAVETGRAIQVLKRAGAVEVIGKDLGNQGFEHAAARERRPWIRYFTMPG
jgi:hypothetical protein